VTAIRPDGVPAACPTERASGVPHGHPRQLAHDAWRTSGHLLPAVSKLVVPLSWFLT